MRDWLIMVLLSLDVTGCAAASAELLCCCSSPSCSACCLPWSLMIEQRRTRSSYMFIHVTSTHVHVRVWQKLEGRSGQTFLEAPGTGRASQLFEKKSGRIIFGSQVISHLRRIIIIHLSPAKNGYARIWQLSPTELSPTQNLVVTSEERGERARGCPLTKHS